MKINWPSYIAKRKDTLAFKLFHYMMLIVIIILVVQAVAEQALVRAMLKVPISVQNEMQALAHQANVLIKEGDKEKLVDWENSQPFYLFVLDENYQPITNRSMNPHFKFKLKFKRKLDEHLEGRASQPIFTIPLINNNNLVIQLPYHLHPAHDFTLYFSILKVVIALVTMALFSQIIARHLQQPLDRLREASKKLSNGDFNVNVESELKSNTREFNELAQDFDHMSKEIHSLAKKQRQLICDVSHELRTPLSRQNLILYLLKKRINEKEQVLVNRMEEEANELDSLIGEILEFSRIENSRYQTQLKRLNLDAIIRPQIKRFEIDLQPGQHLHFANLLDNSEALCDEQLLIRCLGNLVSNAIKYAGDDAVIKVTISNVLTGYDDRLVVSVSDNGPGVADDMLSAIFDPFTRLDDSRDKKLDGYGIGLAIVKESMRVMKGKVHAVNKADDGLDVMLIFRQ